MNYQSILAPENNPSYQNYLAKQALANPKQYGINISGANTLTVPEAIIEQPVQTRDFEKLNSLLDIIDSSNTDKSGAKRKIDDLSNISADQPSVDSPYDWSKQFDYMTNNYYYYNHKTGVSQWEKPEAYIDSDVLAEAGAVDQGQVSVTTPYAVQASFTSKNGKFSTAGSGTYWEKVCLKSYSLKGCYILFECDGIRWAGQWTEKVDKCQVCFNIRYHKLHISNHLLIFSFNPAFFDLQSLDRNRQEAKEKRAEILVSSFLSN